MEEVCKVLIVEDEIITRQALKYIIGLESEKFSIIGEASNGKEALKIIDKESPHVVITDIVMPIIDGIELTKSIKLKYPQTCVIILSSHGDFNYVKSTFQCGIFDYILKPELEPEKLLHILHEVCEYLGISLAHKNEQKVFLRQDVLTGESNKKTINEKRLSELSKEWYRPLFCIIGCELKRIEGYESHKKSFYTEVIVDEFKKHELKEFNYAVLVEEGIIYIIFNFKVDFEERLDDFCTKIQQDISAQIPSLFLVVGNVFNDFNRIATHMNGIKACLNLRFYLYHSNIIFEKQISKRQKTIFFNRKTYKEKMEHCFFKEGFKILTDFLEQVNETCGIKEEELKKIVENTLYNTFNILDELEFQIEELSTKKMLMFSKISGAKHIDDLRKTVKMIIDSTEELLQKQNKVNQDNMLSQMIEHIDTHYNEAITLHNVAEEFHLSYSYLSSYFNTNFNKGFSEYLNEVRLNKAKELLSGSDKDLREISEAIGYTDQSYFSKVFKKITGYSPSKYRRLFYNRG